MKKKCLYLGLDPSNYKTSNSLIHCPIIKVVPFPLSSKEISKPFSLFHDYTHVIFGSKSSVQFTLEALKHFGYTNEDLFRKQYVSVGQATAQKLTNIGIKNIEIAKNETSEGIIEVLNKMNLKNSFVFWPHSALSRPLLSDYLIQQGLKYQTCLLYTTIPLKPDNWPNLEEIDEIVFTSPSTVDAYLQLFGHLPKDKKLIPIGPITADKLCACGISPISRK